MLQMVENDNLVLKVYRDDDPTDPREWDNIGTMICAHKRYVLGDERAENVNDYSNWQDWLKGEVLDVNGGPGEVVALPLYLMDHSGLSIYTNAQIFRAFDFYGWDWGRVGWIWATKDKLRKETGYSEEQLFGRENKAEEILRNEVEIYDQYLRGDAFGFTIESVIDGVTEIVDSCCGFYGPNHIEAMKGQVDERYHALLDELD